MRFPRASAVIVALSTFVAVATVATLASQLSPLDRAGALLPDGPIVTTPQPVDAAPNDENTPSADGAAPTPDLPAGAAPDAPDNGATVVDPAPAEPVTPDPEPSTPTSPGNSGSAPGQSESPGNSGNAPGQGKP